MSMTHDEMIAVITHHRNGGKVQYRKLQENKWKEQPIIPLFNFIAFEYSIKPEPLILWAIHHGKDMVVCSKNESYAKREFEKTKEFKGYTLKKFVEVTE